MSEQGIYQDREINLGTCENMYYLRAEQLPLISKAPNSLDPQACRDSLRFRFPWPDEDGTEPGAFEDYDRSLTVAGVTVPEGVDHYRDGCPGAMVKISQQRFWEGRLVLVARCGDCGAAYRMPDFEDVEMVVIAVRSMADRAAEDDAARWAAELTTIADRIVAGHAAPTELSGAERAPDVPAVPAVAPVVAPGPSYPNMGRDEAIRAIRAALRARSGKTWSVKGGRGTSWGWIEISAPPARHVDDRVTEADALELQSLLSLGGRWENCRRVSVAAASDYRAEYVARAEGRTPEVFGSPYWD